MQFPRKVHLEARRRRVLRDDVVATPSKRRGDPAGRHAQPAGSYVYTEAARADGQPRITDLIPLRVWTLLVIILSGMTCIAGLETLHAHRSTWLQSAGQVDLDSLNLAGNASLAAWFGATILVLASAYALVVFSIRRHKIDDYRGRYGLWLWAAAGCLLGSMDTVARLHNVVRSLLITTTGTALVADGAIWWVLCAAMLYALVGTRVLLDMRECTIASVFFALAAACYVGAIVLQFDLVSAGGDLVTVMLRAGTVLLGHLLLLVAFMLYARHVFLAAQGQVAASKSSGQRRPRRLRLFRGTAGDDTRKTGSTDASPSCGTRSRRKPKDSQPAAEDDSAGTRASKAGRAKPTQLEKPDRRDSRQGGAPETSEPKSPAADEIGDDVSEAQSKRLSKAERRRMRKQLRRQQRAA